MVSPLPMPPPEKRLKRGTSELEVAVESGEVALSLPKQDWRSWMDGNPEVTINKDEVTSATSDTQGNGSDGVNNGHIHTISDAVSSGIEPESPQKAEANGDSLPRFDDIIGHEDVKLHLEEVLLPMALPAPLANSILSGIRSLSASILLFGPPGCGKTQLAKAIAGEAQAAFLSVGPSDVLSKFVGESEASLRSLFDRAYEQARSVDSRCSVLFFDEIDALGQARGGASESSQSAVADPCSRRILAELLIQLNRINSSPENREIDDTSCVYHDEASDSVTMGCPSESSDPEECHPRTRVIVVAATNRPEDCDPALVRRFGVKVVVGLPTHCDRSNILRRFLKDIDHKVTHKQFDQLATVTEGWSGSELESLTREAAMAPVRECIRSAATLKRLVPLQEQGAMATETQKRVIDIFRNLRPVTGTDFDEAISFWEYNHAHIGVGLTCNDQAKPNGVDLRGDYGSDDD